MTVIVVYAREPIPAGPSVFLAGPTPHANSGVRSWRPDMVDALDMAWDGPDPLIVLTPESRGGVRAVRYQDQFDWENAARLAASVVLFWIPRDVATLPGFTTNVEFGHDVALHARRVVLGCPPDCPNPKRNRYVIHLARRYAVPVRDTLTATADTALALVTAAYRRTWRTPPVP
jgi:hypothetical protein